MRIKKSTVRKIILVAITLLILNLRPALAGQVFFEGLLLGPIVGLGLLYVLLRFPLYGTPSRLLLLIIAVWFVLYLIIQTFFTAPVDIDIPVKVGIVLLFTAGIATFLFGPEDIVLVLKTITYFFLFLALSQLITYGYLLFGGAERQIFAGTLIPIGDEWAWAIEWYLPFTLTAGIDYIVGMILPRAAGIFREPGIYQMFITLSFFSLDYFEMRFKLLARLLLLFSLFTTISTAGYVFFLLCLFYREFVVRKSLSLKTIAMRLISISIIVSAIYLVIWYAGSASIVHKLSEQEQRYDELERSISILFENPAFGQGFTIFGDELGVHFISVLPTIGLLGGSLYLLMVGLGLLLNYRRDTFLVFLPIIATLLFAQPMYQKGFTIFILCLSTRILQSEFAPVKRKPATQPTERPYESPKDSHSYPVV